MFAKVKIMRKILLIISMTLIVLLSACGNSLEGGGQNTPSITPKSESEAAPEGSVSFEILNNSGGDIYEVFVAKAESGEFGEDLLKEKIIKVNEAMSIYIMPIEYVQYYDIKALREDGEYYTWLNVPLGDKPAKVILGLSSEEGPVFTTE